jgi:membrane protein YqaA with SNARE-associated domain
MPPQPKGQTLAEFSQAPYRVGRWIVTESDLTLASRKLLTVLLAARRVTWRLIVLAMQVAQLIFFIWFAIKNFGGSTEP